MTQGVQTLDSALAAIAAEREALKTGQASAMAQVPTSSVPRPMPLPPIPKAPGLVQKLPQNLQSVTRLDTVPFLPEDSVSKAVKKGRSHVLMVVGNMFLSAFISVGSFFGVSMLSAGSDNASSIMVLAKSDKNSVGIGVGKQGKISAASNAQMNKSCTLLYKNPETGVMQSVACHPAVSRTVASTTEVTQFSTQNTSATINPNKFTESLRTSNDKILGSLSSEQQTADEDDSTLGNQFSQTFSSSGSMTFSDETSGIGDDDALQLKPRGIVKKFYSKN